MIVSAPCQSPPHILSHRLHARGQVGSAGLFCDGSGKEREREKERATWNGSRSAGGLCVPRTDTGEFAHTWQTRRRCKDSVVAVMVLGGGGKT